MGRKPTEGTRGGRVMEPFVTAAKIVDSGLFPDLTEQKLRHYVRQGLIKAYGPGREKTYLISEVYEGWKNIGRRVDGGHPLQAGPTAVAGGLPKAWRKVS